MIISFGGYNFKYVGDFSVDSAVSTENFSQLMQKPTTQINGEELEKVSFSAAFVYPICKSPDLEIDRILKLKASLTPHPLLRGGGQQGKNKWILKSVKVADTVLSGKGKIISAKVNLSFEEFFGEGQKAVPADKGSAGVKNHIEAQEYKASEPSADRKRKLGGFYAPER